VLEAPSVLTYRAASGYRDIDAATSHVIRIGYGAHTVGTGPELRLCFTPGVPLRATARSLDSRPPRF
jgi:hypothetical protein